MKRKVYDDRTGWLFPFDEPKPTLPQSERPVFDPSQLRITEDDGEPFVLETDLGEALGYARADNIKRLIDRLERRPSWGSLRYRDAMIPLGKGARRSVRQRLLTEKQVVLTCMACELPNIDEVQSLIADVFVAWRHGKLRPVDAETEVQLQVKTDQAIDVLPDFWILFGQLTDAQQETRKAAERAARAAEDSIANQRRYPSVETVRTSKWVIKFNYRDFCPCCQRVRIGPDYVGAEWAHMKGKYRREVRDGWFVCEKCNQDYEDSRNTKEIYIAFIAYLGFIEVYLAQGQLLLIDEEGERNGR